MTGGAWRKVRLLLPPASIFFAGCLSAGADVRLPAILSADAVLQKSQKTCIWGWAEPGEKVRIDLDRASAEATTDKEGRWSARLDTSMLGEGPFPLSVEGKNKLVIPDILVGDVWLSSGQSNMQFTLNATTGGAAEMARSANARLRWFQTVSAPRFLEPQEDVPGRWWIAGPDTSGNCSGVAYYFGKKLQADLKIPVGLVLTAVGGTTIQSWMSAEALARDPELKEKMAEELNRVRNLPAASATQPRALRPYLIPTFFFNQLISPLAPLALRGVIWYQGEAHFNQGPFYRKAFPLLIEDWRRRWQQPDLPFYYCQLPNLGAKTPNPAFEGWVADLRSAQDVGLLEPQMGEAILIDAGEVAFHPRNKEVVGRRLAGLAEAGAYGLPVTAESPRFASMTVEGSHVKVRFGGSEGGLTAQPLAAGTIPDAPGSQVQGFALGDATGRWVWAEASIQGDTVNVWSPQIPLPSAIRYAWSNNPTCNLYNSAGLPAAPFQRQIDPAKAP